MDLPSNNNLILINNYIFFLINNNAYDYIIYILDVIGYRLL